MPSHRSVFSKFLTPLFLFLFLFLSCSKEKDDATPLSEDYTQNGGIVYTSQTVKINFPVNIVNQDEYTATLGSIPVTVLKISSNEVGFVVPSTANVGKQDLIIPDLINTTVHYEVKLPVLSGTADEEMDVFFTHIDNYCAGLGTDTEDMNTKSSMTSVKNYYQSLSTADKTVMALAYKANKPLYDSILTTDFSHATRTQVDADDIWLVKKHALAVVFAVGGAFSVLYATEPISKVLGGAVTYVAFKKARKYHAQLAEKNLNKVQIIAEDILGFNISNRTQASTISFKSGESRDVKMKIGKRKLDNSMSTLTPTLSGFFKKMDTYNYWANRTNTIINWINNNVPLVNIHLIPLETLTSTLPEKTALTQEEFNLIQFSVNDNNVILNNISFDATGNIKVKLSLANPTGGPVTTRLYYSLVDDFSRLIGYINVTVHNENVLDYVTIGTQVWATKNAAVTHYNNGDPIPYVEDATTWANMTTGAWCYAGGNSTDGAVYGVLYNWYALTDPRGIAPEGWHVATSADVNTLLTHFGGNLYAGRMMKNTSEAYWIPPNDATNSTGFNALGSGGRDQDGNYNTLGFIFYMWTCSPYGTDNNSCYGIRIRNYEAVLTMAGYQPTCAFPTRFVKNP